MGFIQGKQVCHQLIILVNLIAPCPQSGKGIHPKISSTLDTVTYCHDRSVFTLCTKTFKCLDHLSFPQKVTVAKSFVSADGVKLLAVGTVRGILFIYDYNSKRICGEYAILGGAIRDLAWTSDGRQVIVGGEGRERFGMVMRAEDGCIQSILV